MPSIAECPFCGGKVASDQMKCPFCGAANELYVEHRRSLHNVPRSIGGLTAWCAERGIVPSHMRFFIGEDFREPCAFGIYRDSDRFIVYKNKSGGDRIVRYDGPDEAYAVRELFAKLLDECHSRGIYPENR